MTDKIVIGQFADYFNTGMWTMKDGRLIAPEDLTIPQLRDFLVASGGAVYLAADDRLCWIPPRPARKGPWEALGRIAARFGAIVRPRGRKGRQ